MLLCAQWLSLLSAEARNVIVNSTKLITSHSAYRQFHSNIFHKRLLVPATCSCQSFHDTKGRKFTFLAPCDSVSENRVLMYPHTESFLLYQSYFVRLYCQNVPEPEKSPSLLQRFKKMYKDYWYVLVPVHLVTSAFWFTSFYYLTKSGVDIAAFLESIGAGEKLVEKLRSSNSTMGYIAISYALYKIATPVRYTVTLGGTTLTIKYLRDWGYIKPIPPKDKIKEMIHEKKDIFLEKKEILKSRYREKGFIERILIKIGLKKNQEDKN